MTAGESRRALRDLVDAANVARRVSTPGSVIKVDDVLPYRCLVTAPRHELELLVDRTLGGLLVAASGGRQELLETLWVRHRHDSDKAALRTLKIDPRTLRRRRQRIHALTGLDPSREVDRFLLTLGLHALRVLESARSDSAHERDVGSPYPGESHRPGMRPNFVIAAQREEGSGSAPHPPRTAADRAGGKEQMQ